MNNSKLFIRNRKGETSRIINWQNDSVTVAYGYDSRRIEFFNSPEEIKDSGRPMKVIHTSTVKDLDHSPIHLANGNVISRLKSASEVQNLSLSVKTVEEEDCLNQSLKWSAMTHLTILGLIIVFSFTWNYFTKPEEPKAIKIVKQNLLRPPVYKRPTVNVSKKKIKKYSKKKVVKKKVRVKKSRKVARKTRPAKKVRRGSQLKNVGVLGALGGIKSGKKSSMGRLKASRSSSRGRGHKNSLGSGSLERSLSGKALVKSGSGGPKNAQGTGRIKTKGRAGGQSGYGTRSFVGSSGAYTQPLSHQALVEGGLDRDQISAVIQRNLGQVVYCYEKGLQKKPGLSGRVAVRFVIGGSGVVRTAKVANTSLRSSPVESCILKKLKAWRFPKPVGNVNVKVVYPFHLRRVSQG